MPSFLDSISNALGFSGQTPYDANQHSLYPSLQDFQKGLIRSLPEYMGMQGWDKASNLINQRLQPYQMVQNSRLENALQNQGIMPGTEAWKQAKMQQADEQNNASIQAQLAGSQVQNQLFNQPLPYLQYLSGVGDRYGQNEINRQNAQNAKDSALLGGVVNVASGIAKAFSDRRLKHNIELVDYDPRGFGIYKFDYISNLWGEGNQLGVLADEVERVLPHAVSTHWTGFKQVNYKML